MKRRMRYMGAIPLIPVFLSGWCLCSDANRDNDSDTDDRRLPAQEGWHSELRLSIRGKLQAVVQYGHLVQYEDEKVVYFDQGVGVDFFDADGNHSSRLTAERGEYHEDTEDIFGMGNVVVLSDSGLTLKTERLRWDQRLEKIISDTTVMLTTEEHDTLYGVGFESNADLSRRVIHNPWGVTARHIDFQALEDAAAESPEKDSIAGVTGDLKEPEP